MNAYYAEFQPVEPEKARPHHHPGTEFLHVLRGRLALRVRGDEHVLDAGDSITFDASAPHSYRRVGRASWSAIVVTAP
jgi:quercetin dioxygenase-like cupin family protein